MSPRLVVLMIIKNDDGWGAQAMDVFYYNYE